MCYSSSMPNPASELPAILLAWYDRHQRTLPWRARPGEVSDPYHVWLSEIMLQQTTVATVKGYYEEFLTRWPMVEDLAAAELDDVLHAWQGLGYYARARNLYKCAKVVAEEFAGRFPDEEEVLLSLPGIGPYTAAAIAAIAFGRNTTPVDGNIERVVSRLYRLSTPLPDAKPAIKERAAALTPAARCGDYAQAVMDLGATICTPKKPACSLCPWNGSCQAFEAGDAEAFPKRAPKKRKPTRYGVAFWLEDQRGRVFLQRREERGLLGGMMEFPSTEWVEDSWRGDDAMKAAPAQTDWQILSGMVRHTFTHFHLELTVFWGQAEDEMAPEGVWSEIGRFGEHALPTVMKKVAAHVLGKIGRD